MSGDGVTTVRFNGQAIKGENRAVHRACMIDNCAVINAREETVDCPERYIAEGRVTLSRYSVQSTAWGVPEKWKIIVEIVGPFG